MFNYRFYNNKLILLYIFYVLKYMKYIIIVRNTTVYTSEGLKIIIQI